MSYKFVCIARATLSFVSEIRYIYQNVDTLEYVVCFAKPIKLFHTASDIGVDIEDYIKLNNMSEQFLMNNMAFQAEQM